ncbi:SMI1/KNR4 family protein [Longimicrobium sp.]|uniref:SMI1/KNR4 family protein n=1 Tax=Longimicrobium sp. TaxID=2029185 RepID=UPI002E3064F7|nr:SMI1/KNR4 family protein [Longimicrobium sp.]HEX6040670.1 SMI1/KNR4 family protein [Longimicrobium sp.]
MIRDIHELKATLIRSGIAAEADLAGCGAGEIEALERRYGVLPDSYRQILALIGHGAGALVDDGEFWIYLDQIDRIPGEIQAYLDEVRAEGGDLPPIPPNAFFISARYGEHPNYVLTGGGADSVVYVFNYDDETVAKVFGSVWDWIEAFVQDTQFFMALAASRGHPLHREAGGQP